MRFQTAGIRVERQREVLRIIILGEIDHHSAKHLRDEIDGELFKHRPRELVLSLGEVGFMDSSGLGLILGRLALTERMQCKLRLCDLSPRIERILSMAGIERLSGITIEREGKENTCENRR